jgi:hypothetical protein
MNLVPGARLGPYEIVAALNHLHILTLFDFGAENGVAYTVTELVEGRTLRDVLIESGAVPARKAIEYGLQRAPPGRSSSRPGGRRCSARNGEVPHAKPNPLVVSPSTHRSS